MEKFSTAVALQAASTAILAIAAFGIICNIFCLFVLLRKQMKSSFNVILMGLTCSDILLLLKSCLTSLNNLNMISLNLSTSVWTFKFLFLLSWLCDGGTKTFTVAVSLNRYIAICHPLRAKSILTHGKSKIFVICVTLYVLLLAVVNFGFKFFAFEVLTWSQLEVEKAVVLNFGPFIAIFILNARIYHVLRQSSRLKKSSTGDSATPMLLTVVLVFGFCYSFEFCRRVLSYTVDFDIYKNHFHLGVQIVSDLFYVINSSINFFIYYLLGKRFRSEFLKMMKCFHFGCWACRGAAESGMDSNATSTGKNITGSSSSSSSSSSSVEKVQNVKSWEV